MYEDPCVCWRRSHPGATNFGPKIAPSSIPSADENGSSRLMSHPAMRTKMSLWDAKIGAEPSEIQPKNTIEEIFLRTRAWEGLMRNDVPCDRADENGQKSEVPSSCGRKYPSNRATETTDFGRFRMGLCQHTQGSCCMTFPCLDYPGFSRRVRTDFGNPRFFTSPLAQHKYSLLPSPLQCESGSTAPSYERKKNRILTLRDGR